MNPKGKHRDFFKVRDKNERVIDAVPMPLIKILSINDLFDNSSHQKPNMIKLRDHLVGQGRLSSDLVLKIIGMVISILKTEPNILRISPPTNIVGDIHGQFYDLLTIFSLGGSPENFQYLFMGDFVDRGLFSFECVCYLFSLKIKYPNRVFLLRGNHESRHLTKFFTFKDECLNKANEIVYDQFMQAFDSLPVACILDNKFCKI
jgi:serine/threonine-protein phosphatase 2B catalytic subunit